MPFPTPQNAPTIPPAPEAHKTVNPEDFSNRPVSLDALLNEFNTPKQDFTPKEPEQIQIKSIFEDQEPDTQPAPPITTEQAKTAGRNAAKMLDTGISFALKMFARDDSAADYKASTEELSEMAEPLSELSEKYNFKISPEIVLIFLIVTIYMPKYFIASERRALALEKRQEELEQRMKKIEKID